MQRRALLRGAAFLPVAVLAPELLRNHDASVAETIAPIPGAGRFDASVVKRIARELAAKPYAAPDAKLPDNLGKLTYDQYRTIRFDPAHALWHGGKLPFEVQFFHRGFLYNDRVDIFEVADGQAQPVRYKPELFDLAGLPANAAAGFGDLGFAGFRIHAAFNRADYADEVCVFLGASYFRAVGKNQGYGLSARGLSIKTGDPGGEEFPSFRSFWLERPQADSRAMVIHALLDSPSAAAAYRFTIRPGEETIFDVEMTLYPRVDLDQAGIAATTSMFYFDASGRVGIDDYRRAVHDSDGLLMWSGRGEQVWRPLANPKTLQRSEFGDTGLRGFGMMQRKRRFADYDDLEAHYERRPSLWIEPIGDVGDGAVHLVEIPTRGEVDDNVVAFWRPKQKLAAHGEYGFTYRQHWCNDMPLAGELARFTDTRSGAGNAQGNRRFVLEVTGGSKLKTLPADAEPKLEASATPGKIINPVVQRNPETGGWRVNFELAPGAEKLVELRVRLAGDPDPLSET